VRYLAAGAGAGVLLLIPFLAGLSTETGYMRLALVSAEAKTPFAQFLVVWWPLLVLAIAVVLFGQRASLAGLFAALFVALLVFTELVNAPDGIFWNDYIRFNPILKWWGWFHRRSLFDLRHALGE
jgi:hypothetical protein